MLHMFVALSLFANPNISQNHAVSSFQASAATGLAAAMDPPTEEEMDRWLDEVLNLLQWLCEILGPEFCDQSLTTLDENNIDDHLLIFINEYTDDGVPIGLTEKEEFRARTVIEDLYARLQDPLAGSPGVLAAMDEALIGAYEDLGGDPADL